MKKSMKKRNFFPVLLFLAALALSSCNRGYGCPTNLSEALPWDQVSNLLTGFLAVL